MRSDTPPSFTYTVPFHVWTLTVEVRVQGLRPPLFVLSCHNSVVSGTDLSEALQALDIPSCEACVVNLKAREVYALPCRVEKGAAYVEDPGGWRLRRSHEVILSPVDPRLPGLHALFQAERYLAAARNDAANDPDTDALDRYLSLGASFAFAAKDALPYLGLALHPANT